MPVMIFFMGTMYPFGGGIYNGVQGVAWMSLTRAATCCAYGPVGCPHGRQCGLTVIICSSMALGRTRCHEDCSGMRGW